MLAFHLLWSFCFVYKKTLPHSKLQGSHCAVILSHLWEDWPGISTYTPFIGLTFNGLENTEAESVNWHVEFFFFFFWMAAGQILFLFISMTPLIHIVLLLISNGIYKSLETGPEKTTCPFKDCNGTRDWLILKFC